MSKLNKLHHSSIFHKRRRNELLRKIRNIKIERESRMNPTSQWEFFNNEICEKSACTSSSGNKVLVEQDKISTLSDNKISIQDLSKDGKYGIINSDENSCTNENYANSDEELMYLSDGTSINADYEGDWSDSDDESILKINEKHTDNHDGGSSTESSEEILRFNNNQETYEDDNASFSDSDEEVFVFTRNQSPLNANDNADIYTDTSDEEFLLRDTRKRASRRPRKFRNYYKDYKDISEDTLTSDEYLEQINRRESDTIVGPLRVTGSFTVIDTRF